MASTGMVGQGCGSQPTGEKCPRIGLGSGERAAYSAMPCQLCGVLRRAGPPHHLDLAPVTGRGLRIALVDDDEAMRLAARKMVRTQPDGWELEIYRPCREARGPTRAKGSPPAKWREVGVVLIGLPDREAARPAHASRITHHGLIGVPDPDGARLACVRRIKALAPDLPVLIVSRQRDSTSIAQYCMAGADGWLTKPVASRELGRAVRSAIQGDTVLCRQAEEALLAFLHQVGKCKSFRDLSARQQEILICLGANLSNKDIGQPLRMSHHTVHVQVARLLRKADVHTRKQLVKRLLAAGAE